MKAFVDLGWRNVKPRHIRVAVRGWLMSMQISVRAKPSKPGKLNDEPKAFMIGMENRFIPKYHAVRIATSIFSFE